jgi:hypothetical protein
VNYKAAWVLPEKRDLSRVGTRFVHGAAFGGMEERDSRTILVAVLAVGRRYFAQSGIDFHGSDCAQTLSCGHESRFVYGVAGTIAE